MDINGRYNHIEDVLVSLHTEQWFGWTDSKNKVYANLILHPKIWDSSYEGKVHEEGLIDNPHSKPTEKSLTDSLAKAQSDFDAQEYARNRASAFPSIGDQLDMQYHDQLDGTTTWKDAVAKVKSDNPKE